MILRLFLAGLTLGILPVSAAENADDDFFALGTECVGKNGGLQVHFYPDALIWLNGVRQATHEDDPFVQMKPGDVVVTGSPVKWHDYDKATSLPAGGFYRYRLDLIADGKAHFTLSSFADNATPVSQHAVRHAMIGQPMSVTHFEITLPTIIFGLDGPNYLETSTSRVLRSK